MRKATPSLIDQLAGNFSGAANAASVMIFALGFGPTALRSKSEAVVAVIIDQTEGTSDPTAELLEDNRTRILSRLRELHDQLVDESEPIPAEVTAAFEEHGWDLYVR
jgi:hypothetical protein